MKYLWVFIFFIQAFFVKAQPTSDIQLASHYYQNKEFDKAAIYYEKLYKSAPNDIFYTYLLQCYFEINEFKKAKKLVKNQQNLYPQSDVYRVDEGSVLLAEGDDKKADKYFNDLIIKVAPNQNSITNLAKAFNDKKLYAYALATFQQGRKILKHYPFNFEIANVYGDMGNFEGMIDEYLELLLINEGYLQTVQNVLSRNFGFDKESKQNQVLKSRLLYQIQQNPNKLVFSDMLIWLYLQEDNFSGALRQAKAIDNRKNEEGDRIIEIAELAGNSKKYDVAIQAYEYLLEKGKQSIYYTRSKVGLMGILDEKITTGAAYTDEDIAKLLTAYRATLNDLGKTAQSAGLMRKMANIYAYYANESDSAVDLLLEAINIPRISAQEKAYAKLLLGDVLIIQGFIWDASLYYSQVDKDFKYDVLGEEAKYRNAKVSYYTGDFQWAKAQLDVLKGSTAKLIANDAMRLSLVISDHTGMDTSETALKLFAQAELLYAQNKFDESFKKLDSINAFFPYHTLNSNIYYLRYKYHFKKLEFENAAQFLEKIISETPRDILADDAAFLLAELYQYRLNNEEKAKEFYQKILTDYSNSLYVVEARKRFRVLRGDNLN